MRKKLLALGLGMVLTVSMLAGCGSSKDEKVTIGISVFAEHGSLRNCEEGFLKGLKEEGYSEEEGNLEIVEENANADTKIANQIAADFVSKQVDMICAIATPGAQAAFNAAEDEDIPVIYTAVSDPVAAQLADKDGTPVGEVTGTSDDIPYEDQLKLVRSLLPDAKNIGILHTTSEANSDTQLANYKKYATKYGFKIVDKGISASADIPLATDSLLKKVDCIVNLTDNTVVSSLATILDKANEAKIPVFGSETEQVQKGCIAGAGIDYVDLGVQTGKMAAKVLKGEKKASEMKYEVLKTPKVYVNTKVAKDLGITISDDVKIDTSFDKVTTDDK